MMRIVVMGVSGSGKSSVARGVAETLGGTYLEADDLHPAENVAHMAAGKPLDDAMRAPWLERICQEMMACTDPIVVTACSALKRDYRSLMRRNIPSLKIVYLDGSKSLIASRMAARQDHFMPLSLLDSQFATLEIPTTDEGALHVSIAPPLVEVVAEICDGLSRTAASA